MSLGEIIRSRRKQLGLTQDRLAAQSDISKPYLSHVETNKVKNPPTDRVLRLMEKALGLEAGELTKRAHLARTPADVRDDHELLQAEVSKLRAVLKELMSAGGAKAGGGLDLDSVVKPLLAANNVSVISAGRAVPVINRVAAGYPQHFTDMDYPPSVADDYVRCEGIDDPQAFAARVVGDSMEPDYHEGDVVVFSPNTPPRTGDDCFVRFADDNSTTFKRYYPDSQTAIRLQPLNSRYPAEVYGLERISGLWPAVLRIERLRRP